MSKYTKISANLIGIAAITAAAFIGFGAIFNRFELGIGTQAATAAFGALFVLLSTKFLMEQESESRIQAEKRTKIFERHLEEYREAAMSFLNVIENEQVDAKVLHTLLERHSRLILLGDEKAIKASNDFIKEIQKILLEDKSESEGKIMLTPSQLKNLWGIAFEFLRAARQGLELPNDNFNAEIGNDFVNVIEDQSIIDNTPRHRQALQLSQWIEANELDASISRDLSDLRTELEGAGLLSKVTKTQISFYNPKHPKEARVIYINYYSAKDDCFNLSFNSQSNLDFFESEKQQLKQQLDVRTSIRLPKGKHDLVIWLPSGKIRNNELAPITDSVKRYIKKFHG